MKSSGPQSPFSQTSNFNWPDEIDDISADVGDLLARAMVWGPGEFGGKAVDGLETARGALTSCVRRQPFGAVAFTFVTGALLGALALRR